MSMFESIKSEIYKQQQIALHINLLLLNPLFPGTYANAVLRFYNTFEDCRFLLKTA